MDINSTKLQFAITCIDGEMHFASSKYEIVVEIVMIIINFVNACLGTLVNGLVIMAYCRNLRLRTIQNTIFWLLALTDVSVTAVVGPTYAVTMLNGLLGKRDCLLWDITILSSSFFLGLSLVTIAILNIQSYITLAYPFRSQSIITKRRLAIAVVSSWLLITTLTLTSVIFRHTFLGSYVCVAIIFLTIFSVIFTWIWTYKLVSRHRRVIQTNQTPAVHKFVTRKKILRSTVTAFLVTSSVFGCYFLGFLLSLYSLISAWRMNQNLYWIFYKVTLTLMYSNSLLNPCFVFWRSSDFREAAKDIFT